MDQSNHSSRRAFLKGATLAGAALSIPSIVNAALAAEGTGKKIKLSTGDTVLFQGDSITDAGRKRDDPAFNTAAVLGNGYAMLAASELLFKKPALQLKIYNRGISGNKVFELADRWEKDCLALQPNVLSLLIGVNDFWHVLQGKYKGTLQTYRDDLRALLDRTKQKLPDLQLIIGEPFAVAGIKAVDEKWYPAFNEYRAASREIAGSFGAAFIPYQSVFDKAMQSATGAYWTHDGVHPSLAGSKLMAQAWLETVKR
jgi:lysophospholipase L1-like esterase